MTGVRSSFPTVARQTLADRIYDELRRAIVHGELEDGAELNQVDLAAQFGVSRVPVREALRRLQAEELIAAAPYQRYVVTTLTPAEVLELVEVREELEVFALRRAYERLRRGEIEIDALRDINDALQPEGDGEAWLLGDRQLHRMLFGGDGITARLIDDIRTRVHRYLNDVVSGVERRHAAVAEHRAVLEALAAGDLPAAEAALRHHIAQTRRVLEERVLNSPETPSPADDASPPRRRRRNTTAKGASA